MIRTAIRNQLSVHGEEVKRSVARRTLVLGLQHFSRADLERALTAGHMLQIQVVDLARIANDVSPELARATIQSVEVLGRFTPARQCETPSPIAFSEVSFIQRFSDRE